MSLTLDSVHRRVLGVLIEKSMTQPDAYPMTLNAIVTACNQRQNRDPVTNLAEGDIGAAVYALQQMQLVAQADTGPGARSNRFRHCVEERFGWGTRERAVMAELLLRGPQTPGELRGRASRMTQLDSVPYVVELLTGLELHDPPFVHPLPRAPGQSATRYAHLFYLPDEPIPTVGPAVMDATVATSRSYGGHAVATADGGSAATADHAPTADGVHANDPRWHALERRVASLESIVTELQSQMAAMREGVG